MKEKVITIAICALLLVASACALLLFFKASAVSPMPPAGPLRVAVSEFLIFHIGNGSNTSDAVLPVPNRFNTSTDYLRHLVTNGWLQVSDYGIFALPGLPSLNSNDHNKFTSEYNAWCVVETTGQELPKDGPFLITRNVSALLAEASDGDVRLGTNVFRVITWGGRSKVLSASTMAETIQHLSNKDVRILFP